jgi:hypothetical protein
VYSVLASTAIYFCGCASDPDVNTQLRGFRNEMHQQDINTSRMMEENLDDDLNPVEQRAVHPIFEKNLKEKERMQKDVFGDIPE